MLGVVIIPQYATQKSGDSLLEKVRGAENDRNPRSRAVRVAIYENQSPSQDGRPRSERQNPCPLASRPNTHGSGSVGMVQVLPAGESSVRLKKGRASDRKAHGSNQQRQAGGRVLFAEMNNLKPPLASNQTKSSLRFR